MMLISKFISRLSVGSKGCDVYRCVRLSSVLTSAKITYSEQKYMRSILEKTKGCALFNTETYKHLNDENETISQLASLVLKRTNSNDKPTSNQKLMSTLSEQCFGNHKKWPLDRKLFVLDALHFSKEGTQTDIFECLLSFFLKQFNQLQNGPALQILYYIAWKKRHLTKDETEMVVNTFQQNMNNLTFDEICIFCLALIKSEADVRNPILVKALFNQLIPTNLQKFDEIAVTGILKAVRRFSTSDHIHELVELQKLLVPFAKKANLIALTHVIQLGSKQRVFNPQLVDIVLERFSNDLDNLRIKEIERALLVISTFNRGQTEIERRFCDDVQQHLLKSPKTNFIESWIRCISHLAICRNVDERLVDWALDPKTHSSIYGNEISGDEHAILVIDSYAKINLADSYSGHTLSDRLCAELMKRVPENKVAGQKTKLGSEIYNILKTNETHCILTTPFPYAPFPDIFLVNNKRTKQTVKTIQPNIDGTIINARDLFKNNPDLEAVAIIPCLQRQTVFKSNRFNGLFQLKLDQLQMLGFKPIVIKKQTWKLYRSSDAKRRLLALELCKRDVFLLNKSLNVVFKSTQGPKGKY